MKFGGTSVGDAGRLRAVRDLVQVALPRAPVVVLSAMSGVTNTLFDAARAAERGDEKAVRKWQRELVERHRRAAEELFGGEMPERLAADLRERFDELRILLRGVALLHELSPRSLDAITSMGERLSTQVFAHFAAADGLDVEFVDVRAVLRTDARFGAARPDEVALRKLAAEHLVPRVRPGRAIVTQGYIGATADGLTTTLGRGGSDYSAALLGAALGAEEVQIWTDVEGILTADPRIVPEAMPIAEISFAEAAELAAFGAKVLHPATIQPAVEAAIPVTVRHTGRPHGAFTTIRAGVTSERPVTALAARGPVTVLTVDSSRMLAQSGFLARLFEVFGRLGVSVDLVSTAEVSVSLTVEPDAPIPDLVDEISRFARVRVEQGRAIVAVVGEHMRRTPGLPERVFGALRELEVEMISMGANEINLSLVVRHDAMPRAMRLLHAQLFPGPRTGDRP